MRKLTVNRFQQHHQMASEHTDSLQACGIPNVVFFMGFDNINGPVWDVRQLSIPSGVAYMDFVKSLQDAAKQRIKEREDQEHA